MTRHTRTKVVTDDTKLEKCARKPLFISAPELVDEAECITGYEILMKKKRIIDSKPTHFGSAILQWSKILLQNAGIEQKSIATSFG